MKRITVTVPSMPILIGLIFALLLGMFISTFTAQIANGATPSAAISGPLTGCVGNPSANGVKINLGGRVITPSTILRLAPTGTCASDESTVTWNQNSDISYVTNTITIPGLVAQEIRAYCPAGKQATSGGYTVNIDLNLGNNFRVNVSAPYSTNNGNYWGFVGENFNNPATPNSTATVTVYAICQTLAPGIHPSVALVTAANNTANLDLYDKPVKLNK